MDRGQSTLFPECLEDWICEDNSVRVIDVFVVGLDLAELRFCIPSHRPAFVPSVGAVEALHLRLSQSGSVELPAWAWGLPQRWGDVARRSAGPDHKTIADFRKDNGPGKVCAQFVAVCREIGLLTKASVAIDGSKFKAVNNRDKNFTRAKMERRLNRGERGAVSEPARHRRPAGTNEALAVKTAHL
jgi:transposase